MGPTLVFLQFQVISSHLWGFKIKVKDGRRDIQGEKEGVEQESRKEGKKVLGRKTNKKLIIKNYFFKKKFSGFKLAKPVLLVFLAVAG